MKDFAAAEACYENPKTVFEIMRWCRWSLPAPDSILPLTFTSAQPCLSELNCAFTVVFQVIAVRFLILMMEYHERN